MFKRIAQYLRPNTQTVSLEAYNEVCKDREILNIQIEDLQAQVQKLLCYKGMAEIRMTTIQSLEAKIEDYKHGIKEFKDHNAHLIIETHKLRSSIAHLYHFIASVQELITAFDKRAKMVPEHLDLGQHTMREILEEFDQDLKENNRIKEVLESTSYTIEKTADDEGILTEWLTLEDVAKQINDDLNRRKIQDINFTFTEDHFTNPKEILRQKELGLITIHYSLNKTVKGTIKLWIVPKA